MSTIDVPIYPNRAESIRAGLDPTTTSLEVDLDAISQPERDLLADHDGSPVHVSIPTVEALFEALRAKAEADRAKLDEIQQAFRVVLQERRVRTWRRETKPGGISAEVLEPDWPNWSRVSGQDVQRLMARHRTEIDAITESDEAVAWAKELEQINRAAYQQALAEQQAAEEAEARQCEDAIARLRDWALDHGSERVRLLIEEGFGTWRDVAEDEFFSAHTPDGFTPLREGEYTSSLPAPDVPDIQALREARDATGANDALGEPKLVAVRMVIDSREAAGRPGVRLVLTAPHGEQRIVWRPVSVDPPASSAEATEPPLAQAEPSGDWLDDLPPPTLSEAIAELRGLIDAFEDVPLDGMTTMFYMHAYNQLIESSRQLLELLEPEDS